MTIISFEKKFIFIKTRKVAGTSIEASLRGVTGPRDIVAGVIPRDEYYSAVRGEFSKNYLLNKDDELRYTQYVLDKEYDKAKDFLKNCKKTSKNHMSYQDIDRVVRQHGFKMKDFYVFTVERHPYSWCLSRTLYNNSQYNSEGKVDYADDASAINNEIFSFLNSRQFIDKINWPMYTKRDKVMVDKVIDYDNLKKDMGFVLAELSIDAKGIDLPDMKKNSRHLNASDILDYDVKDLIYKKFNKVFSYMGYSK